MAYTLSDNERGGGRGGDKKVTRLCCRLLKNINVTSLQDCVPFFNVVQ